ncbi:hypothetical protein F511_19726 [Dorcoceras hygrometricum]|uniref:Uncharacterized protein n=1 Tax=Dorcoceras hygrometricum TaxID=472368 RepID=A0A2Z7AL16_9LAMI|nr:hypothetical protein F511_19726 [Dorcoceras hygrometricum]
MHLSSLSKNRSGREVEGGVERKGDLGVGGESRLLPCFPWLRVQKRVDEQLENFNPAEPSVNYDYTCIRFLSKELKEITRQHRDLRVLAGLPIVAQESSIAGDGAEQEQAAARKAAQPDEQIKMGDQIVEQAEDTENGQLGFSGGQQEQPVLQKRISLNTVQPTLPPDLLVFIPPFIVKKVTVCISIPILILVPVRVLLFLAVFPFMTFMKHDFGTYKNGLYDKMDTVAANITTSQTSLETSLVRQLTEHQLQLASDLDFVKLQLAELVNHLKETGDSKKREGGQRSRQGEGPSRHGPNAPDLDEAHIVGHRNQIGAKSSWLRKNQLSAFRYTGRGQTSKGILVKLVNVKPDQDIEVCWFRINQLGDKSC